MSASATFRTALWRTLLGATLVFLAMPLAVVVLASFNGGPVLALPPKSLTLQWFGRISPEFWQSLALSLRVAAANMIVATLIGVPAALALVRGNLRHRALVHALCLSPLMVPSLVIAVGSYQLAVAVFDWTGVSYLGTETGLVIGHCVLGLPFVIRSVIVAQAHSDPSLEEASRSLGAGRFETFWRVTLPLLRPGIVSGAIFAFIVSFEDLAISLFLGGTDVPTLPVKIYTTVEFNLDGQIMAISAIVIAASLAMLLVVDRFVGIERVLKSNGARA